MTGPKIHVWRPLSEGQPYLSRIDGLRGITFEDATAMGAAKRARTWLEDEKSRVSRTGRRRSVKASQEQEAGDANPDT